jgi:hypothetical protein
MGSRLGVPDPIVLVASFDGPDAAREAMIALEANGFDADDIRLAGPDSASAVTPMPETERASDAAVFKSVGRRVVTWGAVGAVVGAAIAVGIVAILGSLSGASAVVAILVGGIFGSLLAGMWGAAYKLPVNEDAYDTLAIDPRADEPVRVEVRARGDEQADKATSVLRDRHASRIDRTPSAAGG